MGWRAVATPICKPLKKSIFSYRIYLGNSWPYPFSCLFSAKSLCENGPQQAGGKLQFQKYGKNQVTDDNGHRRQEESNPPPLGFQSLEKKEKQEKGAQDKSQPVKNRCIKE
jgi:hypothetical protein